MLAILSRTSPRSGYATSPRTVEVRYGTHRVEVHLDDWTIGQVKAGLRDQWGLPYFAVAVLNGRVSEVAILLQPGDRLEFRRPGGFKASEDNPYAEADLLIATTPRLQQIIVETKDSEAVRKTVQFCLTWLGRQRHEDVALVDLLVERIAVLIAQLADRVGGVQGRAAPTEAMVECRSPYLTARQAAAYLKISYSTFRKKAHLIKVMPGTHRYRREDLDEYTRAHRPRRKR